MIYSDKFKNDLLRKEEKEALYRLESQYTAIVKESEETGNVDVLVTFEKLELADEDNWTLKYEEQEVPKMQNVSTVEELDTTLAVLKEVISRSRKVEK